MPIFEFECESCGGIFEVLMKREEEFPPCPFCGSQEVLKVPSIFGFQDKAAFRKNREEAILKRTREYLVDGKVRDAKRFLEKAKEFQPTDKVKRLSEALSQVRPPKGSFLIKREATIYKKKG